jgi:hypothetical protein
VAWINIDDPIGQNSRRNATKGALEAEKLARRY